VKISGEFSQGEMSKGLFGEFFSGWGNFSRRNVPRGTYPEEISRGLFGGNFMGFFHGKCPG